MATNPLKDIKVKIGKSEVSIGDLARGGEPLAFDGARLTVRRKDGTIAVSSVFDQNTEGARSKTIQSEANETDINLIIEKAIKGNLPMVNQREPRYGDFASGFDFSENQRVIKDYESQFERLPSSVRSRFNNDPAELIDFASDPQNEDEAIKLGILPKKPVEPVGVPPATPEAPVVPVVPTGPAIT